MKGELYTVKSKGQTFEVIKCDSDFNYTGKYEISKSGGHFHCTCYASNKPTCRHRAMLLEFISKDAIDSGKLFEFDKNRWVEFANA